MSSIETWWNKEAKNKIFRYKKYKKVSTSYKQNIKSGNEDIFEDDYHLGFISNIIEIPNDILLVIKEGYFDDIKLFRFNGIKVYVKLSEIKLIQYEKDNLDIDIKEYINLEELELNED